MTTFNISKRHIKRSYFKLLDRSLRGGATKSSNFASGGRPNSWKIFYNIDNFFLKIQQTAWFLPVSLKRQWFALLAHLYLLHVLFIIAVLNEVGTITTGVDSLKIENTIIDTSPITFKVF